MTTQKWGFIAIVFVAGLALMLGLDLSKTDLLNFITNGANARAKDQATNTLTQKDTIDLTVYQAQQEAKITEQQQATVLQATKAVIDRQTYLAQQTAQAMKQVAEAKQYEAQQLAQAEADRQRQLAQIEVQREQQLAQIRTAEQNQAQQRAEQAARTAEELKWANLLNTILAIALILAAGAVVAGVIFGAVALIWSRLQRTRLDWQRRKPRITRGAIEQWSLSQ